MSSTLQVAETQPRTNGSLDEVVLTPEGYAKLEEEHRRLATVRRPEVVARLSDAAELAGDLADNPEYLDASNELDVLDERIELLARRLHAARLLRPEEESSQIVSIGSQVVLDDLDDSSREEYVLVCSAESDPAEGLLSNESPVGRAIAGRHRGDVIDVHTPHSVRHLRIADLHARAPRS